MEQQTLGSNYPNVPSIHEILLAEKRNRPPLLRRSSRSDPNLDEQSLFSLFFWLTFFAHVFLLIFFYANHSNFVLLNNFLNN